MLNFAEQTGSGAVIVVWSFLSLLQLAVLYKPYKIKNLKNNYTNVPYLACATYGFEAYLMHIFKS